MWYGKMQHGQLPRCMFQITQSAENVLSSVLFCCSLLQEYTLAHIDKPDTLAGADKALKKHEDFLSTMEANEDKIDGALQGGQRLVDSNNLYSGKVQDKMNSIRDRSVVTTSAS